MINKNKVMTFGISALLAFSVVVSNYPMIKASEVAESFKQVNAMELVNSPQNYLNNKIKIVATFDKFSTLGLDYKPAMRDSKDYISFLIRRQDVSNYTIPLSELKLIIKRDKAEKMTDLESGDQIELTGQVFSNALNDPWVDVENIKIISSAKTKTVSDKKLKVEEKTQTGTKQKTEIKPKAEVKQPAVNKTNKAK